MYSFNLSFEELPESLQEQKIDEMIKFDFENNNVNISLSDLTLEELLENERYRESARRNIEMRFPMYF